MQRNKSLIARGADLTDAVLKGEDLNGFDLTDTNLTNADLTNANLTNAVLTNAKTGSINGSPKVLPNGWEQRNKSLIGPGADLTSAVLKNADLNGLNFTDANLTNADLINAKTGTIIGSPKFLPNGWNQRNKSLIGAGADLTGAVLKNADLNSLDFTDVNLTNAVLTNAKTSTIIGIPKALPEGWVQRGQSLIGPYANLNNANLEQADLSKANFLKDAFKLKGLSKSDYNNGLLSEAENSEAQKSKQHTKITSWLATTSAMQR